MSTTDPLHLKPTEPIITCPGGIPNMRLSTARHLQRKVFVQGLDVDQWAFLTPPSKHNIPSFLLFVGRRDFLSSISISFPPGCHSTFVCWLHHWSFQRRFWLNRPSFFCHPAKWQSFKIIGHSFGTEAAQTNAHALSNFLKLAPMPFVLPKRPEQKGQHWHHISQGANICITTSLDWCQQWKYFYFSTCAYLQTL